MDRRQFIKAGTLLTANILFSGKTSANQKYPTFEEFIKAPTSLGQEYLNGRILDEFGNDVYRTVSQFVYDHDGMIWYKKKDSEVKERLSSDVIQEGITLRLKKPDEAREVAKRYFKEETMHMNDQALLAFFERTDTRILLDAKIYQSIMNQNRSSDYRHAVTSIDDMSGESRKSSMYIFGSIIKPQSYFIGSREINYPATEFGFRATLHHELQHANDTFYGITIGGFKINLFDRNLTPEVDWAISESRGWSTNLEFLRQENKMKGKPSDRYNNDYVNCCKELYNIWEAIDKFKEEEIKNDWKLLMAQKKQFEPYAKEAKQVIEELAHEYKVRL